MSRSKRPAKPSTVTAPVIADKPASAMAAKLILDSRAVANSFTQSCFAQAARLDGVSLEWAFMPEHGVWRHRSRFPAPETSRA